MAKATHRLRCVTFLFGLSGNINKKGSAIADPCVLVGGPCRDRTDDLLHAMEALSQLS